MNETLDPAGHPPARIASLSVIVVPETGTVIVVPWAMLVPKIISPVFNPSILSSTSEVAPSFAVVCTVKMIAP